MELCAENDEKVEQKQSIISDFIMVKGYILSRPKGSEVDDHSLKGLAFWIRPNRI